MSGDFTHAMRGTAGISVATGDDGRVVATVPLTYGHGWEDRARRLGATDDYRDWTFPAEVDQATVRDLLIDCYGTDGERGAFPAPADGERRVCAGVYLPHRVRTGDVVRTRRGGYARCTVRKQGREVVLVAVTEAAYRRRPRTKDLGAHHHVTIGEVIATDDGTLMVVRKLLRRTFSGALGRGYVYTARGPALENEGAAEQARRKHRPTMLARLGGSVRRLDYDAPLPDGAEVVLDATRDLGYGDTWYAVGSRVWLARNQYDFPPAGGWSTVSARELRRIAALPEPGAKR